MIQLIHKTVPFIWIEQYQKAVEKLKDALMKSPIFVDSDPNKPYICIWEHPCYKPYILFVDALQYTWSAVLTQEHAPIIDYKL